MLPGQRLQNPIFQQHNLRFDFAKVISHYRDIAHIAGLPWPALSSDLSPIEQIWDMMERRLSSWRSSPNNMDDLQPRVKKDWPFK